MLDNVLDEGSASKRGHRKPLKKTHGNQHMNSENLQTSAALPVAVTEAGRNTGREKTEVMPKEVERDDKGVVNIPEEVTDGIEPSVEKESEQGNEVNKVQEEQTDSDDSISAELNSERVEITKKGRNNVQGNVKISWRKDLG